MTFILHENLNKFNLFAGGRFNIRSFNKFNLINFDSAIQNDNKITNNQFKLSELDKTIFCTISLAYYHKINDNHIFIISVKYNKNLSTVISISESTTSVDLIMLDSFTYKIEATESEQFSFNVQVDILNEASFGKTFYSVWLNDVYTIF